jgi:tetratricopeptide (TPR) repeat protein
MIFISYRKADTQAVVDHLADRLRNVFGPSGVFKDDRELHGGDIWPHRLRQEVMDRQVLLAVIGAGWLTALDEDGRRRLDDPDDWVRQEICTALEHGKRVVVLLVDAAKMPTKRGLPGACHLQALPDLQALPLRTGRDAEADLVRLIDELHSVLRTAVSPATMVAPATPANPTILVVSAAPCVPAVKGLPPRPPVCFGREAQLAELVTTLVPSPPETKVPATPVVGIGGIGKSTFVLTALHHESVRARYAERRHFVRLDGAPSRSGLVAAVAEAVGLPLGDTLEARLLDFLERGGRRLLVLDNAETPLLAEDRTETEELLGQLAALPDLAVVATLRGTFSGPGWRQVIELRRLDDTSARQTFLAGTSGKFAEDAALDSLLRELDGWPLGLSLLAYQARYEPNLKELTGGWRRKRAALLTKGVKKREADLGASIEMSLRCPLLTLDARRLLSLLGLLPDGIHRDDLAEVLLPDGADAAVALRRVGGLAFDDGPRLRVLAPLREYLAVHLPPQTEDRERAIDFYCRLAAVEGNKMGRAGGKEACARLAPEAGNSVAMVRLGLSAADSDQAFQAVIGLGRFGRYSGLDLTALLHEAELLAKRTGQTKRQAECLLSLGKTAQDRYENGKAELYFEEARALFHQIGDVRGEADCIQRPGAIALRHSDYTRARQCYESALPLFRQAGDVLGEANCIKNLAYTALLLDDHAEARRYYEMALPLFRQAGYVLGEAFCIKGLSDIALACRNHKDAKRRYKTALMLYQQVGYVRGEAACIMGLGDIALAAQDFGEARRRCEMALPLYQQVGNVRGEASCLQNLGRIARKEGQPGEARLAYERALTLFQRIASPQGIATTHQLLAHVTDDAERQQHLDAARAAWGSIHRLDLIAALDKEFGSPAVASG